jgi:hypothetical protein
MHRILTAMVTLAMLTFAGAASATDIYAGSPGGAYFDTFCPPIPNALDTQYFSGYTCQQSKGTLDNIKAVQAKPSSLGFVQKDVFALQSQTNPDLLKQLVVVRSDIACEGLWMVTKNPRLKSFGDVLGYASRIPFVLPPQASGSTSSFKYLQTIDPEGLGAVLPENIKYVDSAKAVIETVANSPGNPVGFFVQFADPENPNIKLMQEKGLTILPVVSRQITAAKVGNDDLYQVQSFNLTAGGLFRSGDTKVTACTPVAIITGNPEAAQNAGQKKNQAALVKVMQDIPSSSLLPQEPRLAKLISGIKRVSSSTLDEMLAAADKAREAAQKAMQ